MSRPVQVLVDLLGLLGQLGAVLGVARRDVRERLVAGLLRWREEGALPV
jgi:hypothetical protein